jgi:hypothetical protein
MPASAEAPAIQRVKCRQIVESDLDALADLYVEGFLDDSKRDFWIAGLSRVRDLRPVEGMPRFGYVLEAQNRLVGALLTLSSRRGDDIISNVSGWYVQKPYRAHSMLLVSAATSQKHVIYLNASPAPHTRRTLQMADWKPYSFGQTLIFPSPNFRSCRISETIPHDLPERTLLEDHRQWNCASVVCATPEGDLPFVLKRQWIGPKSRRLPVMQLMYCRNQHELDYCAPALARHFVGMPALGLLIDGKAKSPFSIYRAGRDDRYYKGPRPPALNDLAYTEKVVFP